MHIQEKNANLLVISYLTLRRSLGVLGILLPFILYFGAKLLFDTDLQPSISAYYHTGVGDVLVGVLFAFGVFLYSYLGYDREDEVAGFWGAVFAIGLALFPTTPRGEDLTIVGFLHLVFTVAFFGVLIFYSLVLFVKSDQPKPYPPKKQQRNTVYKVSGWVMILCMAGIGLGVFLPAAKSWLGGSLIFWMETFAIWAFGIAWFVKGEALKMLND